jgi:hypothetical protein
VETLNQVIQSNLATFLQEKHDDDLLQNAAKYLSSRAFSATIASTTTSAIAAPKFWEVMSTIK